MASGSQTSESWRLYCEGDEAFLKGVASEYAEIGTPTDGSTNPDGSFVYKVQYFQRDKSVDFDPVYQENTTDDVWRGPYSFPCTVEFEEAQGHYESDADESDYDNLTEAWDVDSETEVEVDSDDEAQEVD